jgi:hypothetical protein
MATGSTNDHCTRWETLNGRTTVSCRPEIRKKRKTISRKRKKRKMRKVAIDMLD